MNHTDLVRAVADATNLSSGEAAAAVTAVVDSVAGALAAGDSVAVKGLGTFEVRHRAARSGRNPRTGEPMEIAASVAPAFKAAAPFKRAVAGQ
jgi:DNA-binding protein HU-beta